MYFLGGIVALLPWLGGVYHVIVAPKPEKKKREKNEHLSMCYPNPSTTIIRASRYTSFMIVREHDETYTVYECRHLTKLRANMNSKLRCGNKLTAEGARALVTALSIESEWVDTPIVFD